MTPSIKGLHREVLGKVRGGNALGFAAVLCCAFLLHGSAAFAQTAGTGALSGTVTDPSGASVAGAQVKVTNTGTGEARSAVSGTNGAYIVPLLSPGRYDVEVTRSGFKTAHIPGVVIIVTETAALDIRLEIGEVSERVTVEAATEQLQTESSTLGRVTSGEQVTSLPLVTRNYTQIIALNPGVAAAVNDAGALGRGNLGTGGAPIVSNGVSQNDNNVQMNGVGINDLQSSGFFSGGVAIPNPDTIQEFKVQTGQYDASYGRNAGANVDLVTKSGTKQFHGALWEFFRNDDLNANTFFRNSAGQPRPVLKQNQFGFDLGGPIRREKLLFFTSYQGTRQRNGLDTNCSSSVTSPPVTNDRSAAALGALFAGRRGVFGGTAIAADGSNINPVSLKLLQLKGSNGQFIIPTPQTVDPTKPFGAQGFSAYSFACPYTEDQFMTNGDWQMTEKSTLVARFFFANTSTVFTLPGANLGGGTVPGFPVNLTNNFRNFTLTHSYIFSPTLVNQILVGFHRTFSIFDQSKVFRYSDIGATVPGFDDTIPALNLDALSATGVSIGGNGQTVEIAQNTYSLQDSLSWTHGRHNLRFGGGLSRPQLNQVGFHFLAGQLYLSWADFLLGMNAASNGTPFSNVFGSFDLPGLFDRAYRVWEGNAYAQDDIKVTRRLTINLGFRYDHIGDMADAKGRNASFDFGLANPNPPAGGTLAGTVVPSNFSGGAIPPGVTQIDNEFGINGDGQNTWNPRVGFAWRLPHSERFVLRGGYGIYHSRFTGQPFIQLLTAPPFAQARFITGTANASATAQVPFSLSVPTFPAFVPYSPTTRNTITVFAPEFRPPMIQEYSLGLQSELVKDLVLEVAYSGARGLHLIRVRSVNQAGIASAANPIRGQATNTRANIPLRVPFQGFTSSAATQIESEGASWYNALLVSLTKGFGHGLRFQGSYTFAKDLATDSSTTSGPNGGTSVGDQNNPPQRYGPDTFIPTHRFIANYTYELPGPKNRTSLAGESLGGWSVAGVTTVQSGRHLTPSFTNGNSIFGISNDRASVSGACTPSQYAVSGSVSGHLNDYVNKSCFATPAVFSADDPGGLGFGNAGVGIFEGPGQNNWDLAVIKTFPVDWPREGARFEFRTEFYNAFNHPQFGDPSLNFSPTSATFGRITTTVVSPRVLQFALKFNF